MAKAPKQSARDAKLQTLDSFTSLLREEPTKERYKKRLLSGAKMQQNNAIKVRFTRYSNAIQSFNAARRENMEAKIELQRFLKTPLYESKLIIDPVKWDCGINNDGSFWFKDDEKSFEERYKDFQRQIGTDQAYDDGRLFFDNSDTPATTSNTSADTSEGTSGGTPQNIQAAIATLNTRFAEKKAIEAAEDEDADDFYDEELSSGLTDQTRQLFLTKYRDVETIQNKWKWVEANLSEEALPVFFHMLSHQEKKALYPYMNGGRELVSPEDRAIALAS